MKATNLNLKEKELELLTKDIMDTSMMMGGDFQAESIRTICKEYIASKYIPTINQIISEMMEFMGINYNVVFDKTFKATITSNGYNVTINKWNCLCS